MNTVRSVSPVSPHGQAHWSAPNEIEKQVVVLLYRHESWENREGEHDAEEFLIAPWGRGGGPSHWVPIKEVRFR